MDFIQLISYVKTEFVYSINKYKHMRVLWFSKSVNFTLENICCLFTWESKHCRVSGRKAGGSEDSNVSDHNFEILLLDSPCTSDPPYDWHFWASVLLSLECKTKWTYEEKRKSAHSIGEYVRNTLFTTSNPMLLFTFIILYMQMC